MMLCRNVASHENESIILLRLQLLCSVVDKLILIESLYSQCKLLCFLKVRARMLSTALLICSKCAVSALA